MSALIGKVGIVMKGTWNSSTSYEVLDAVSYNNGLYIAKQSVPANTLPTNTTYWQVAVTNQMAIIEDTTPAEINTEKTIANDAVNNSKFIYVGNLVLNSSGVTFSNSPNVQVFTTQGLGIRIKVLTEAYTSKAIKILGYIIP